MATSLSGSLQHRPTSADETPLNALPPSLAQLLLLLLLLRTFSTCNETVIAEISTKHTSIQNEHPRTRVASIACLLCVATHRQALGEGDEDGALLEGRGRAGQPPHQGVVETGAVGEHHGSVAPVTHIHVQGISEEELNLYKK